MKPFVFPVKKIIIGALVGFFIILASLVALSMLIYYEKIGMNTANFASFFVIFLGGFAGCMPVKVSTGQIYSGLITVSAIFLMLMLAGITLNCDFSVTSVIFLLIILIFSAIINSVVKVMTK